MTEPTYGSELRRIREAAGFGLCEVARKIGCNPQYLSDTERGVNPPIKCPFRTLDILQVIGQPDEWRHLLSLEAKHRRCVTLDLHGLPDRVVDVLVELRAALCEDRLSYDQWDALGEVLGLVNNSKALPMKQPNVTTLHREALRLSSIADGLDDYERHGELDRHDLWYEAYKLEREAAILLRHEHSREPERSMLFISAISMFIGSLRDHSECMDLIDIAFEGNPHERDCSRLLKLRREMVPSEDGPDYSDSVDQLRQQIKTLTEKYPDIRERVLGLILNDFANVAIYVNQLEKRVAFLTRVREKYRNDIKKLKGTGFMAESQNARNWLPEVTTHAELETAAQVLEKFADEIDRVDIQSTEAGIKNHLASQARANARILRETELTK